VEPLVVWIWVGGLLMLAGTALSAWPGRRRQPTDPVSAPTGLKAVESGLDPAPEPAGVAAISAVPAVPAGSAVPARGQA
jgi:cytochrome c-type biogenesis protein CcmF